LIVGPHGSGQADAEDRHFNSGGHLRPNPFLGLSNYTQRKGAKDAKSAKKKQKKGEEKKVFCGLLTMPSNIRCSEK
jgi:hypothetical protein